MGHRIPWYTTKLGNIYYRESIDKVFHDRALQVLFVKTHFMEILKKYDLGLDTAFK